MLFRSGDIIVKFAGESVESWESFTTALAGLDSLDPVDIEVMRQGADGYSTVDLKVTPEDRLEEAVDFIVLDRQGILVGQGLKEAAAALAAVGADLFRGPVLKRGLFNHRQGLPVPDAALLPQGPHREALAGDSIFDRNFHRSFFH